MKKLILSLVASLALVGGAQASGGSVHLDKAPVDVSDIASLQRGAKLFVNYCLNCHSASAMRYNRLRDIGLTDVQIKDKLTFTTEKIGDTMKAAIDPKQAKDWFGATPPDLSVIARAKASGDGSGADYLYTYLRSFYRDETRPTGWNNVVFPNVGMPHAMWELQGERRAKFEEVADPHEAGKKIHVFKGFEQITPGTRTAAEFDRDTADLVNYLQWMGEPAQNQRKRLGAFVLLFLGLFSFIAWRMNASFWKDVK